MVIMHIWMLLLALAGLANAGAAWLEEWERVLQAAKKEGKVAIIGPIGADRRDALTIAFEKKYGISVEYHADSGAGILPRLSAERKADRYLWDAVITGTTTTLENLIPARVLDPLEANLILPEVKDLKLWRNGALEFLDPGRQLLVMTPFQRGTLLDRKSTRLNSSHTVISYAVFCLKKKNNRQREFDLKPLAAHNPPRNYRSHTTIYANLNEDNHNKSTRIYAQNQQGSSNDGTAPEE